MPLHDWRDDRGWGNLHSLWQHQLFDWIQPRLPEGYRAFFGSFPALSIGESKMQPDVGVGSWPSQAALEDVGGAALAELPDLEAVAVFELEQETVLQISRAGYLVAAVELVSPRNKGRPSSRARYLNRYEGCLRQGVHLLLVDVLPRPAGHSLADGIAAGLGLAQPPTPSPFAVSYRVGEPVPDGTLLAFWRRTLTAGEALPTIPLALNVHEAVPIDLEATYSAAAKRAYLP